MISQSDRNTTSTHQTKYYVRKVSVNLTITAFTQQLNSSTSWEVSCCLVLHEAGEVKLYFVFSTWDGQVGSEAQINRPNSTSCNYITFLSNEARQYFIRYRVDKGKILQMHLRSISCKDCNILQSKCEITQCLNAKIFQDVSDPTSSYLYPSRYRVELVEEVSDRPISAAQSLVPRLPFSRSLRKLQMFSQFAPVTQRDC